MAEPASRLQRLVQQLRNAKAQSSQAKEELKALADALDTVARKAEQLANRQPGQFATGGGRISGMTAEELSQLQQALTAVSNLGGEYRTLVNYTRLWVSALELASSKQQQLLQQAGFKRAYDPTVSRITGPGQRQAAGLEPMGDLEFEFESAETETQAVTQAVSNLQDRIRQLAGAESTAADATRRFTDAQREAAEVTRSRRPSVADEPIDAGLQIPTAAERENLQQIRIVEGNAQQVKAALSDQNRVAEAARKAMSELQARYQEAGHVLENFRIELNAVNESLEVQGMHAGRLGDTEFEAVGADRVAIDLDSQEFIDQSDRVKRTLREIPGAFQNLDAAITKNGMSWESLVETENMANEGLIRFKFRQKDVNGAIQKSTLYINQQGEVLSTTRRKFSTFGQAIRDNIVKVVQWGVAVGAVYGTMNKLRQTVTEMIDLQTSLADIQIITGQSAAQVADSLEEVINAAEATGMTLGEATAAYEKALRAAGSYREESVRLEKANQLVADSLMFARLANIDNAKAIDTLTGAIRQAGLEIDQAEMLLDKWVATSKVAFVSMEDLGESFAIAASQAEAVGVNVDELNGVIATIATVTTLSATEIGNLARTMLSALERDEAINTLQRYGVAIKDVTGEFRSWTEVIQDVYDLLQAGAISERQLSEIATALGGGARRGPQIVAFIKEYGRVNEVAAESAQANGDAADALDTKMGTLKNTANELGVAFSKLALSLGEDGGLLDFLTDVVEIGIKLVEVFDGVIRTLGDTTTTVIALGAALALASKYNLGPKLGGALGKLGAQQTTAQVGQSGGAGFGVPLTKEAGKATSMLKSAAPAIGYGIGSAAISYMTTGDATSAVGAGIGGAIGGYLGGPFGAMIGSTIGQAIASNVDVPEELRTFERHRERGDDITLSQALSTLESAVDDMRDWGDEIAGRGPIIEGENPVPVWGARNTEELLQAGRLYIQESEEVIRAYIDELDMSREEALDTPRGSLLETMRDLMGTIERLQNAQEENTQALDENTQAIPEFAKRRAEIQQRYGAGFAQALGAERREKVFEFTSGDIKRSELTRYGETSETLQARMPQIFDLFHEKIGESQRAFNEFGLALANLDPEQLSYILDEFDKVSAIASEAERLMSATDATVSEQRYAQEIQREALQEANLLWQDMGRLIETSRQEAQQIYRPAFQRMPEGFTGTDADQIEDIARQNQEAYAEMLGTDPGVLESQAEPFVRVWDDTYHQIMGLHSVFWEDAVRIIEESKEEMDSMFSVRRLEDVDPGQFGEIQARNRYWVEYLARIQGMTSQQYLEQEGYEENLILGPNNVWQKMLTTSEAMNFTLQDILETEKKQLEGMWNIPEGATFWVPITSLFYQNQGGGGGVPELPPLEPPREDREVDTGEIIVEDREITGYDRRGPEPYERRRERMMERERYMRRTPDEDIESRVRLQDVIRQLAERSGEDPLEFYKSQSEALRTLEEGEGSLMELSSALLELSPIIARLETFYGEDMEYEDVDDELRTALNELIDSVTTKGVTGEAGPQEGMIDYIRGVFESIQNVMAEPISAVIDITLEPEKSLFIENVVKLDASIIHREISRITARETGRIARSEGVTSNLRGS